MRSDHVIAGSGSDATVAVAMLSLKGHGAVRLHGLERLNINPVCGEPNGGHGSIEPFFLCDPFARASVRPRGLIQIAASTHPGPGLGGRSACLAARRLGA